MLKSLMHDTVILKTHFDQIFDTNVELIKNINGRI